MHTEACRIIDLPKISDPRGNLTSIEGGVHIPFEIQRVYYVYDIPGGTYRGAHAHREVQQLIVSLSGSFDVVLNDGREEKRFHLNRPDFGLYVRPITWNYLENYSSGAVCMVLASLPYDENEYIRDFSEFMAAVSER